jgi:hypothetical protein
MTYLTIPDELDKRLAVFAAGAHVSKDEYALHVLEEFLYPFQLIMQDLWPESCL